MCIRDRQSVLRIVDQAVGLAAHRAPGHVAVAVVAVDVAAARLLHRMRLCRLRPRPTIPRRRRTVHIAPYASRARRGIHPILP